MGWQLGGGTCQKYKFQGNETLKCLHVILSKHPSNQPVCVGMTVPVVKILQNFPNSL